MAIGDLPSLAACEIAADAHAVTTVLARDEQVIATAQGVEVIQPQAIGQLQGIGVACDVGDAVLPHAEFEAIGVGAGTPAQIVVAGAADQQIVARAAGEPIVAAAAGDVVVAGRAVETVAQSAADEGVAESAAGDRHRAVTGTEVKRLSQRLLHQLRLAQLGAVGEAEAERRCRCRTEALFDQQAFTGRRGDDQMDVAGLVVEKIGADLRGADAAAEDDAVVAFGVVDRVDAASA